MDERIKIRMATVADVHGILEIYKYYVKNTTLTFEYEVPSEEEFRNRISNTLKRYPYLVAEYNGEIVGYAYAGVFHTRAAYAWNAEMTIYLKHNVRRNGIGKLLYSKLEEILKAQGVVKTIALITMPTDEYSDFNSMQFHQSMGYKKSGQIDNCGYKFGRWYSLLYMDKQIGTPETEMGAVRTVDEVREEFRL